MILDGDKLIREYLMLMLSVLGSVMCEKIDIVIKNRTDVWKGWGC